MIFNKLFTHFQEIGVEISARVGSTAKDTEDNYRGEYSDCEGAADAVAGLLMGNLTAPLGWQQLENAQPKKMVLLCDHFW